MDEYNGHFRIATTTQSWNTEEESLNNLYILNSELDIVGRVEGMAKGERIYSVRFIGNKGYIVTFRTVDPLFVIDLEDTTNPTILGELKIPGFSDYLHPYDENHIIGFGQVTETIKDYYGERVITVGMKMGLFDVSNPQNPKELYSVKIGDRGTYSELLYNHKALLFSREKDIIAFPITISETINSSSSSASYEKVTFQGAIIYGIDLDKGFIEKGKITHITSSPNSYYSYNYEKQVERIIYINDTLFTLSKGLIKAVDMNTLEEKSSVEITVENQKSYPYMID